MVPGEYGWPSGRRNTRGGVSPIRLKIVRTARCGPARGGLAADVRTREPGEVSPHPVIWRHVAQCPSHEARGVSPPPCARDDAAALGAEQPSRTGAERGPRGRSRTNSATRSTGVGMAARCWNESCHFETPSCAIRCVVPAGVDFGAWFAADGAAAEAPGSQLLSWPSARPGPEPANASSVAERIARRRPPRGPMRSSATWALSARSRHSARLRRGRVAGGLEGLRTWRVALPAQRLRRMRPAQATSMLGTGIG
jgi:hypothetical protein